MRTYVLAARPEDPMVLDLLPHCVILDGTALQNQPRIHGRPYVEAADDCPEADVNDAFWRKIKAG